MLSDASVYPTIPASDLARAETFYREKLGLEPARRSSRKSVTGWRSKWQNAPSSSRHKDGRMRRNANARRLKPRRKPKKQPLQLSASRSRVDLRKSRSRSSRRFHLSLWHHLFKVLLAADPM